MSVVAFGRPLDSLPVGPGGSFFDPHVVIVHENAGIPVVVLFYDDSGDYVGTAARVLRPRGGDAYSWSVGFQAIEWVDGASRRNRVGSGVSPYPISNASFAKEVDFRTIAWKSTTAVSLVQNTLFTGVVYLDGVPRDTLEAGEVYHLEWEVYGASRGACRTSSLRVEYLDRGRLVGSSRNIPVRRCAERPRSYVFVLGPRDIQR